MDIIKCDLDPDDFLIWKYPETSQSFGSQVIVNQTQQATDDREVKLNEAISLAKKLEKDGIFKNGTHFFKSGSSNSSVYQWNYSEIVKTFSQWRAPSKEV